MSLGLEAAVLPALYHAYSRQSWYIDHGLARQWAETFTHDGVFDSPTYPRVHRGHDELEAFAVAFDAGNQEDARARHIITNLFVSCVDGRTSTVHAYLSMVSSTSGGSVSISRIVELDDLWSNDPHPLLRHRRVSKV